MSLLNRAEEVFPNLQWQKFTVLNDGFVTLVDVMGDDAAVVQAARVSYGNHDENKRYAEKKAKMFPNGGTSEFCDKYGKRGLSIADIESVKKALDDDDRNLIRYLMRNRHTTPFEMVEVKLLVRVPMDCWRQWIRHRTASVNEYSTRYTEAIDSRQTTQADEWRAQSKSNKQGSGDYLDPEVGRTLSNQELELHTMTQRIYENRLDSGVAKEQARKDLPLSTYTEAYWKCDLHNLLHFLALRMDAHAQQEIREYANIIGNKIVAKLFPVTWEAFQDYRLNAMYLSGPEVQALKDGVAGLNTMSDREKTEFTEKMKRLDLI